MNELKIISIPGIPEIQPGDDITRILVDASIAADIAIEDNDIIVVAQKIVSKSEGRIVKRKDITPSTKAKQFAEAYHLDPYKVTLILEESQEIVRHREDLFICETKHGFVCANAGIDQSNVQSDCFLLLPIDSDASALQMKKRILDMIQRDVAIIISDSFGQPWRNGVRNYAIGIAGINALRSYIDQTDSHNNILSMTEVAIVDELAAAAELVSGKLLQMPVTIIKGYDYEAANGTIKDIIRAKEMDLFH